MKKYFKWFLIISVICIVAFNAICFILPNTYTIPKSVDYLIYAETGLFVGIAGTYYKYTELFWVGYVVIMLSFIGNVIFTYFAFNKNKTKNEDFYSISILRNNLIGNIACFIISIIIMFVPKVPVWFGIIACAITFVCCLIKTVASFGAKEFYSAQDEKNKNETHFIENLTAKAKSLYENCDDKNQKELCKKVYEKLRYSDPVSSDVLNDINNKIDKKFVEFEKSMGNGTSFEPTGNQLISLIIERNNLCKINK